jgi:hypothetical protein
VITFDTVLYGPVSTLYSIEQAASTVGMGVSIAVVERISFEAVERALTRLRLPQGSVVRPRLAGEPALRFVSEFRSEQEEGLVRVQPCPVLQQLDPLQAATHRIDLGDQQVGVDADGLSPGHLVGRRHRGHRRLGHARRGPPHRHARLLHRGRRGLRLGPAVPFPSLPQHEQREAEDEQQDESLDVHAHGTGS